MKLEQFFNNFGLSVNIVIIILLLVVIYYLHILNNNLSMEYFSIGGKGQKTISKIQQTSTPHETDYMKDITII